MLTMRVAQGNKGTRMAATRTTIAVKFFGNISRIGGWQGLNAAGRRTLSLISILTL